MLWLDGGRAFLWDVSIRLAGTVQQLCSVFVGLACSRVRGRLGHGEE